MADHDYAGGFGGYDWRSLRGEGDFVGIGEVVLYGAPRPPHDWVPLPFVTPPTKTTDSTAIKLPKSVAKVSNVQRKIEVLMKLRVDPNTPKEYIPVLDEIIGHFLSMKDS